MLSWDNKSELQRVECSLRLENSLIRVSSIPNRGRLIFDYVYKPTGHSQFYTNTAPMPIETDAGYFLEFGGFYTSYPWNARSNQPYDLAYEVLKETPQEVTINNKENRVR